MNTLNAYHRESQIGVIIPSALTPYFFRDVKIRLVTEYLLRKFEASPKNLRVYTDIKEGQSQAIIHAENALRNIILTYLSEISFAEGEIPNIRARDPKFMKDASLGALSYDDIGRFLSSQGIVQGIVPSYDQISVTHSSKLVRVHGSPESPERTFLSWIYERDKDNDKQPELVPGLLPQPPFEPLDLSTGIMDVSDKTLDDVIRLVLERAGL